jgi:hypothetical protein
VVLGAILTFAVRADSEVVDLQVVGLILMLAGVAVMLHARRTTVEESVVTQIEEDSDPAQPPRKTEERTVRRATHGEHDMNHHH